MSVCYIEILRYLWVQVVIADPSVTKSSSLFQLNGFSIH